jgi:hypothetical protein
MIKLSATACINAPVSVVWEALARIEDIQLWAEPVITARSSGEVSRGVGAARTCSLRGNIVLEERWTAWDEGHSFEYQGFGLPMVQRAGNRWSVRPEGPDQTLLVTEAEVELKGGFLGRLLEPLMAPLMRRMGKRSLASLKFLIENGRPFDGDHSTLPLAPITC